MRVRYPNLTALAGLCVTLMLGGLIASTGAQEAPPATAAAEPTPTREPLACEATLEGLWALASDTCATGPIGFICNGGSAPQARPSGQVENSLSTVGALVETGVVEAVQTLPIITEVVGGGVMWFRWGDPHYVTGLIVGEAALFDVTTPDFAPWTNMIVQTGTDRPDCPTTPHNTFILEAQPNIRARMVVNGVSLDITGAIAIRTIGTETYFVGLSGRNEAIVQGRELPVWTGQQIRVGYNSGNFSQPAGLIQESTPLDPTIIEFLPTGLLDQPVWVPQPGYVTTDALVNMRANPSLSGQLVGQVPAGELLTVLGRNEAGDWLHVSLKEGTSGWMFAELLNQNLGEISAVYNATPSPPQRFGELTTVAQVRAPAGLNVRENPSTSFGVVSVLSQGAVVNMIARSPYGPWVKVTDENGGELGWVALVALDTRANVNLLPIDNSVPLPPEPAPPTPGAGSFGNAFPDPSRPSF
ncbi:MAG: SH3 domain-containing protein [Chloroflexota bacterium]